MLVLSRKCEQSLLLGDDIVVTVLAIDGDRVKLGIEAPRSVAVLRQEVYQQLRSSNTTAASAAGSRPSIHAIATALRSRSAQHTPTTQEESVPA
jgi:carbon storage regulator